MQNMNYFNVESLNDFLNFGIMAPGEYIFSPPPSPEVLKHIDWDQIFFSSISRIKSEDVFIENFHLIFGQAVKKSIENKCINSFALSGGVDSRLIFSYLLKQNYDFSQIKVYTRLHPKIAPDQDLDALLAKQLCLHYQIPIQVERFTDIRAYIYLLTSFTDTKNKCLSGLWGGEILGRSLVEDFFNPFYKKILSSPKQSPLRSYVETTIKKMPHPDECLLPFAFHLIASSPITALYQSIAWFKPFEAHKYTITPFLDLELLNLIFRTDSKLLKDYNLYRRLLIKKHYDILQWPINNISIKSEPDIKFPEKGVNPKSIPYDLENKFDSQILSEKNRQILDYLEISPPAPYKNFLKLALQIYDLSLS